MFSFCSLWFVMRRGVVGVEIVASDNPSERPSVRPADLVLLDQSGAVRTFILRSSFVCVTRIMTTSSQMTTSSPELVGIKFTSVGGPAVRVYVVS